jgi:hypothetical protein
VAWTYWLRVSEPTCATSSPPGARRSLMCVWTEQEIVHDDKVIHRLLMRGTHMGNFQLGIGPGRVMGAMPHTGRTCVC